MGIPAFEQSWFLNGMNLPWYSLFSYLFLLFRSNSKKKIWMRTSFVTVMVIILKVPFWKLLDIGYFQSSQQLWGTLTKQGHLQDTLQLKILRTRINIRVNSFLDKYHEAKMAKMPWKLLVAQKFEPVFEEHCTKTFHSLLYSSFSLKQT